MPRTSRPTTGNGAVESARAGAEFGLLRRAINSFLCPSSPVSGPLQLLQRQLDRQRQRQRARDLRERTRSGGGPTTSPSPASTTTSLVAPRVPPVLYQPGGRRHRVERHPRPGTPAAIDVGASSIRRASPTAAPTRRWSGKTTARPAGYNRSPSRSTRPRPVTASNFNNVAGRRRQRDLSAAAAAPGPTATPTPTSAGPRPTASGTAALAS